MTGQQLKNSILQEAIEGRLVPQDPNDEPASVLLERIRAEKARLVKEKKIKKDKNESRIYRTEDGHWMEHFEDKSREDVCIDDEIPFELPSGWMWERWGNISQSIQYGYNAPALESGIIRMVRISDIQENKVLWESVPFCNIKESEIDNYVLQPNDILFARTGGTVGKSFLVKETPYKSIYAGYLIRTRYSNMLKPEYLKLYMESRLYWDQLRNGTIATAQPNCNGQTLSKMFVPIPPITEQHRIVEKIESLLPKIEAYGKAQEELEKLNEALPEQLKKSILQEAIEGRLVPQDPNDEPASVLLERIRAEKARLVEEKKIKKDKNESRIYRTEDGHWMEHFEDKSREDVCIDDEIQFDVPSGWELQRLSSICSLTDGEKKEGAYVCLDAKYLRGKSTGDYLTKGKYVSKGENIILVDGENSGEVFTVPCNGYMGSTFKQLMTNKEMFLSYVLYFLLSYKELLRKSKRGAAIPHLNKDIFYSLLIGVPPLAEQHRIVEKLEGILPKLNNLKKETEK